MQKNSRRPGAQPGEAAIRARRDFCRRSDLSPTRPLHQDLLPIGVIAAEIVADLGYRRLVQKVHGHGPRVVAELLAEIAAERGIKKLVHFKLRQYAALDRRALSLTGGDRFPPLPVHEVRR